MKLDSVLAKLKTDFHIPIALAIFVTTSVYHFKTHLDLGQNYTNSIWALYAFLGGHAWVNRGGQSPDPPDPPAAT